MTKKLFINSFAGRHVVFEQLSRGTRAVSKALSTKEEAQQALALLKSQESV